MIHISGCTKIPFTLVPHRLLSAVGQELLGHFILDVLSNALSCMTPSCISPVTFSVLYMVDFTFTFSVILSTKLHDEQ